ncbi:hypothetical protein LOTGIDRAFT_169668 [Lottia gigantea]|uniref:Arrestin C-terminal-like domain-containing protein n=1 Tax=Lottia gigantea TaxID=225164 RepID=V4B3S6_LOTGI|nr:hypothetical protein LOTGIDRAFT_169668 [Lottia gigantea]ESO83039.1 hypothetical protein LOTGIDRAFT_169668 [Lottia gigantea]
MKVDYFVITLDRVDGVFMAGEKLEGKVHLRVSSGITMKGIYLTIEGRGKSKWEVYQSDSSKTYKAKEIYIDDVRSLYSGGGAFVKLNAGTYTYPFSINLPTEIPSSFEGRKGHIRYMCRVEIEGKYKEAEQIEKTFTVIHPLDLNTIHTAKEPGCVQKEEMTEDCCCESGLVFIQLKTEKCGFVPGEQIRFTIECHNNTQNSIGNIVLELLQNVTYTGYSDSLFSSGQPKYYTKTTPIELYSSNNLVESRKFTSIKESVMLPAMPPSKLECCSIMSIEYELSLSIGHQPVSCSMFVTIGTIPLRENIVRGAIIRPGDPRTIAQSASSIVSPSHIHPPYPDAPPSYEECVFGRMVTSEDKNSPSHNALKYTPSYPMLNSAGQSQAVTVQPSTSNQETMAYP